MYKVDSLSENNKEIVQDSNKPQSEDANNKEPVGEVNRTDPKVCHDPSIKLEGIARIYSQESRYISDDGDSPMNNRLDSLKTDGILYPLIMINNRNIEINEIVSMNIDYTKFLPTISLKIYDEQQNEQRIKSSQMSSIISVIMTSPIDKVYKKICLNFRTLNAFIDPNDPSVVSYYGEYYVEGFRDVNTMHIQMESVCSGKECGQGGHINANTWEMLHRISELTGLGFAATNKCKDVKDHVVRHINTQRFNKYIEQQLLFSGTDIDNIFDAWVDLYGYIVMVNVPWVLNENVKPNELTIMATVGMPDTSNGLYEQEPEEVQRTLTNFTPLTQHSNMEIESYNMEINNESVIDGTLERIYQISMTENGRFTKIEPLDIQTKQNSIDGEHIEDYNTGKSRPIPKFNFNDPKWTGLSDGYDINTQKKIRLAYFKKLRQSILYVKLNTINFGLQRGTLVNIAIMEDNAINKDFQLRNRSRLALEGDNTEPDKFENVDDLTEMDIVSDDIETIMNNKLSDIYYIDGMTFKYSNEEDDRIIQILKLIKRGPTSGYTNKHTMPAMPEFESRDTAPETKNTPSEQDIV